MRVFERLDDLQALVGQEIGTSDWISVDQPRIQAFADATEDQQWIHTDPARAADGPFGTTIAHGFLTLSLLPRFYDTGFRVAEVRMGLNYGLDRVRFPAPVPVGSRLRGRFVLKRYEPIDGGAQMCVEVTVESEAGGKPVCVAESLTRQFR
ncbi:MAG: MaoC family dehydratase [Burkholderiaceae bacterium]